MRSRMFPMRLCRRLREHSILILDAAPQPGDEVRLRELVKSAPRDPILSSRLGFYLANYGDESNGEEASRLLRESAESQPEDLEIRSNLGWGFYKLGRYEEAVQELDAATELDPQKQKTRMKLAFALGRAGERKRALTLAKSVLALRPAAPWSDEGREFVAEIEAELAMLSKHNSS